MEADGINQLFEPRRVKFDVIFDVNEQKGGQRGIFDKSRK